MIIDLIRHFIDEETPFRPIYGGDAHLYVRGRSKYGALIFALRAELHVDEILIVDAADRKERLVLHISDPKFFDRIVGFLSNIKDIYAVYN